MPACLSRHAAREHFSMNDLIVAEKIAPWQKLKALVRHCSIVEQARRTPIELLDNC